MRACTILRHKRLAAAPSGVRRSGTGERFRQAFPDALTFRMTWMGTLAVPFRLSGHLLLHARPTPIGWNRLQQRAASLKERNTGTSPTRGDQPPAAGATRARPLPVPRLAQSRQRRSALSGGTANQ